MLEISNLLYRTWNKRTDFCTFDIISRLNIQNILAANESGFRDFMIHQIDTYPSELLIHNFDMKQFLIEHIQNEQNIIFLANEMLSYFPDIFLSNLSYEQLTHLEEFLSNKCSLKSPWPLIKAYTIVKTAKMMMVKG